MKIHIDFETRSKVNIKKAGAGRYAMDPSTEILCYAYCVDDGPVIGVWGNEYPKEFDQFIEQGAEFAAYNAFFEYMIWKYVWKKEPPVFRCTMAKVCAHGLPWPLEKAALALKTKAGKNLDGKRLINKFCVPDEYGMFLDFNDYPKDKENFVKYVEDDVIVERHIDDMLPELSDYEQGIYLLTQKINERGVHIDHELVVKAEHLANKLTEFANAKCAELTDKKLYSISQTVRLKNYLNKTYGLDLTSVASDEVQAVMGQDIEDEAKRLLAMRLEFGRSSVAKFNRATESLCPDNRIRNYLIYHGAGTGRWTSQAVQFQNLPRGGEVDVDTCIDVIKQDDAEFMAMMYERPMTALSNCVRGMVVAQTGYRLLVVDYAAIEARVLMWIVGQKDAVRCFREGQDIYVEMARVIYHNKKLTAANKAERQLGKQAVLGCGYQMGAQRFKGTCAGYGIEISDDLAETAVQSYRNTYRQVVTFWNDVNKAAIMTVRTKKAHRCGPVRFYIQGKFLYCTLPSGRNLAYYHPGIEKDLKFNSDRLFYFTQNSQTRSFKKTPTYGGKLTENIVQATARDLMADAMLRLEENNFPVVLSVHDEIICEVPKQWKTALNDMTKIMTTLPTWAKGCPIAAEGWRGKRYKK